MASNAAPQIGPTVRFTLSVKSGPDSDRSYQLLPPKVTIGRDPGNNITLRDPKVSRHQMAIEFRQDRILAVDLSSRGHMAINGKTGNEIPLKDGDVIAIGETRLLFRIEMMRPAPMMTEAYAPVARYPGDPMPAHSRSSHFSSHLNSNSSTSNSGRDAAAKKFRFYLIVGVVAALLIYLLQGPSAPPKKDPGLRTSEEIEAEIRSSEERQEVLSRQRNFKGEEDRKRYEEAQTHYLQGFRDYQKGNYSRAMRSFETARAIDPSHEMAKRYHTLAARQRDEFISRHMLEGRRYKEKHMFSRCVAAIDKALKTLGETSDQDLKVKEAKALRSECEALMKARF